MARGTECAGCGKSFPTMRKRVGHEARCKALQKQRQELRETILSKENLERLYITEQKSVIEIQKELGLDSWGPIYRAMDRHGIPRRTFSESNSLPSSKERRAQTLLERTGFRHNFCKESPSRKAWEARLLEEEGITNVFQREEVIDKIKQTIVERYPDEDPRTNQFVRGRRIFSKEHRRVVELVMEMGYSPRVEKKFFHGERHRILYSFDIYVRPNLLIEVNGNFWHGNPEMYQPDDIIPDPSRGEITVAQKWEIDRRKLEFAVSAGYRVLVVWENELANPEALREKLSEFLATGERNETSQDQVDN